MSLRAAFEFAAKKLRNRDLFSAELRGHLVAGGFEEFADPVIGELTSKRILDDNRVALAAIAELQKKGKGSDLIRAKLLSRGFDESLIDEMLSGDESAEAQAALRKKFKAPDFDRAKAGRFLASRGFSESVIEAVLESFDT